MKTNQTMINSKLWHQRTKDGFFNANTLLNGWKVANPTSQKNLQKYKSNKSTMDFIEQLQSEGIERPYLSSNKGTWMHPKLFVDFAIWVSVEFKSKVIDCVLED